MFDWTNSVINFFKTLNGSAVLTARTREIRELKAYVRNNKDIENIEDAVTISMCLSMYSPDYYGFSILSEPAISDKQYDHLTTKLKEYFQPKTIQITEKTF